LDDTTIVAHASSMNSMADTTARLGRRSTHTDGAAPRSTTRLTRRLVAWWADDPMTASFGVAREHDRHVLRRHCARL
jgi:hypothetical protein